MISRKRRGNKLEETSAFCCRLNCLHSPTSFRQLTQRQQLPPLFMSLFSLCIDKYLSIQLPGGWGWSQIIPQSPLQFQEKNLRGIQIKYIKKKIIIKYRLGKFMSSSMNVHIVVPYRLPYRGTVQWEVSFTLPQGTPSREEHKRFQRLQDFWRPSQPVGSVNTTAQD